MNATQSRNYKRKQAKRHFKNGDFEMYVSTGDWGFYPSHRHWRKVGRNGRKSKVSK